MQKKACVITFGCQQNEADSEKIKGLLDSMGYEVINADMTADMSPARGKFTEKSGLGECSVIIMNTCAVREHAELKAFSRTGQLKHYKSRNKDLRIGLCGCMIEQGHVTEYIKKSFPYVDFIFGTRELHKMPEILGRVISEGKRVLNAPEDYDDMPEDLPVLRDSAFQAKVSVMHGCDNFCSYCVVPYVRGRERSRARGKIISEVRELAESGYKDITLLGQNVNSYRDGDYKFTDLLRDLLKIDGGWRLRFLTSHPKDVPDELIALMGAHEKLARHFHLPAQAGSDRILALMNRGYTRDYYLDLISRLKSSVPGIAVTSDIIVGFPGESEQEFEQTLELVARAEFDNIFPFIYSRRKGTPADSMPDGVSHREKTQRFERLLKLQNEIVLAKNKACEGSVQRVLVESEYKNMGEGWLAGRTSQYKLVAIDCRGDFQSPDGSSGSPENLIGQFADVRVSEGKLHALYGRLDG